ncbi:hypothetical protein KSS82_11750 [Vibrio mimicus]|nr:hypothetical protein [Vibrio mimicus]QXC58708.1 hypothetical protein KSS82_11750 [Vibrio mimicus]
MTNIQIILTISIALNALFLSWLIYQKSIIDNLTLQRDTLFSFLRSKKCCTQNKPTGEINEQGKN